MAKQSYSLREFAKLMGLCERKVQRLALDGKIPGQYRKGKRWRIRENAALGKLGTLGSLEALEEAVRRPLLPKGLLKAHGIQGALNSPNMIALAFSVEKTVHDAQLNDVWELRKTDPLEFSKPLANVVREGVFFEKNIPNLLRRPPGALRVISAIFATQTQIRRKKLKRPAFMTLLARRLDCSRAQLYREFKRLFPRDSLPPGSFIKKVLSEAPLTEDHRAEFPKGWGPSETEDSEPWDDSDCDS